MELSPEFMEPMRTARSLTARIDADLTGAASWELNWKITYWRYMISIQQHQAIQNRNAAENTYIPGTPAHAMYHLSYHYAMQVYSRCKAQFIFWQEGGKGIIPAEAQWHRN